MFEPRKEKVTGERWKLQSEELHNKYCSCATVRMNKSRMNFFNDAVGTEDYIVSDE
jgi:hypothetical protein